MYNQKKEKEKTGKRAPTVGKAASDTHMEKNTKEICLPHNPTPTIQTSRRDLTASKQEDTRVRKT